MTRTEASEYVWETPDYEGVYYSKCAHELETLTCSLSTMPEYKAHHPVYGSGRARALTERSPSRSLYTIWFWITVSTARIDQRQSALHYCNIIVRHSEDLTDTVLNQCPGSHCHGARL